MRPVAPHLVALWLWVVSRPGPVRCVDLLRDERVQELARLGRESAVAMVDKLVDRNLLKTTSRDRHNASREVWWDEGCLVPPTCMAPRPQRHPATALPRTEKVAL